MNAQPFRFSAQVPAVTVQLGMFDAMAPTFAPWADPAKVEDVRVETHTDRDHVGAEEIGKLGNNREVAVLLVLDADEEILKQETFTGPEAWSQADARREDILVTLKRNRQSYLDLT